MVRHAAQQCREGKARQIHTGLRQLDKVKLLALLGARDMGGDEGVHEGLEVGSPPLSQAIAHLPVASFLALAESTDGRQALVQACFEPT